MKKEKFTQMKELRKIAIILITISMMCIQYFFPLIQSFANEEVDVSVVPCPEIDIVLAKSKTKVDVNNFEADLKKELTNQGISTERVKINAVEAVEANIQNSFNWNTDVSSTIGSFQITNNGQNIVMKGNKKYAGKNAIWIIPEKEQEQEINFDYSVDFGDSFNAAGMLLRVKQTGNTLTGYMLSLNKSGKTWYTTAGKKYGAIWKFTYQIGTNTTNMTKTFVQGVDIATSGRLNIKSTDTEIIISGGGLTSPISYTMDAEYGHGFGFFSDHYSHNCSKIGAFTLGNIKLTTTTVKKFKEVLSNPEWRENSLRFLVNVDDSENEELKDKTEFASLQTKLINEQINPIFWGTDKNKTQLNKVIEANNGNGTFIDNTNYTNAIQETVAYIKSLMDASKTSQYALVGESVELKVSPESVKTDTITPEYPQGKWKVNHDYTYFENNLGQFQNSGKYMSNLDLSFDKTGRYELLYEDGSIASKYIYVHRKPVANFNISQAGNNVTLTSTSYDLDSYSNNNGISEEEWKYKKVEDKDWTAGKLSNIQQDDVYVIQLRVKDFQETWSAPSTKYVMYSAEVASSTPVASFDIKNPTLSKYEKLQIENTSYDPAGTKITEENWKVKKDGNVLYSENAPLTDFTNYQTGSYTMSLVVTNEAGKKSEEFSRIFNLTEDANAPEVIATPTSSDWTNQPVTVDLTFSDKGGSKVKGYKYAITDSEKTPASWNELILKEKDTVTIDQEGEKYLHIIGQDNAGNVSEDRVLGPYKIDLSKPKVKSIVPENKDWTKESIDINVVFSDKGGSGFAGYEYAITESQETPENWSELIKEENAKFTISGESQYYLHMKMHDNAGNISDEAVYGPYRVDKTSPEVTVNPSFSDWTNQPITVEVDVSDEGGSKVQNYKYAITDSGISPTEWKDVTGNSGPITIDKEGENYLHIIGCDNAGNSSSDNIFGKYKLDVTSPELINDNDETVNPQRFSTKFTATDKLSGVNKFTVNGTQISGTEYIATKNGEYVFEISDNAGNTLTKKLTIDNLYRQCDKDLGHPNFSTSHEKCPICDLIDGIKVTSSEKTYESNPIGVSYENEKNASIVEYYENALDKPSKVGEYDYELKVNYDGTEYNTGLKGVLVIHQKPVEIIGLKLEDKIEDGTTEVKIDKTALKVQGIAENDKENLTLEVTDKTNYDNTNLGEKFVNLQKDRDYKLVVKENSTNPELINNYKLPETLTLTGKLLAKEVPDNKEDINHSQTQEPSTTEDTTTDSPNTQDVSQNKNTEKKPKDKSLGKLLYTGHRFETSLIVIASVIVFFNMISGKIIIEGKHSAKKKPRILEKVMKK